MNNKKKNPILVTAAIIRKGNEILIAQRNKDSIVAANMWEFPGGKVEFCETPEDSVKREIKEELNLEVEVVRHFMTTSHVYEKSGKKFHIILVAYLCNWSSGECENLFCQDSKWIKLSEIKSYDFAPADLPIIDKLVSESRIVSRQDSETSSE